jgi:hypothetical protein
MAVSSSSRAQKKAAWMAKKRAEAYAAGFCITCCKRRPTVGYKVCISCQTSINEYRRRRYVIASERKEWQNILIAHERAGDKAQLHHLFDDAAQHYHEALSIAAIAPNDQLRLAGKLGSVALLSGNPAVARPWHDRMLDVYSSDSKMAEKAVETLLQMARQCWIDSKTPNSILLCKQAIQIAEAHGVRRLWKIATLYVVGLLNALGRFDDAERYLER